MGVEVYYSKIIKYKGVDTMRGILPENYLLYFILPVLMIVLISLRFG